MAKTAQLKSVKGNEARVFTAGGLPVELLAAAKAGESQDRFRMIVYAGSMLVGHWYWGNVIIDVAGVKPTRQDIAALEDHDRKLIVGSTQAIQPDPKTGQVIVEGSILPGSADEEPSADRVRRRLSHKFPYQASGRWTPRKVQRVEAEQTAVVNGKQIVGPATIFLEADVSEVSFVPLAWDPMTHAMAAGAEQETVMVEEVAAGEPTTQGASTMTDKNISAQQPFEAQKPAPSFLASLAKIFGADRAIELHAAKPDAKDVSAFCDELVTELTSVRAALTEKSGKVTALEGEVSTLKTELEAAKKAPVVALAAGDTPKPPAGAPAANTEEALRAKWNESADLKAEFPEFGYYLAHMKREAQKSGA